MQKNIMKNFIVGYWIIIVIKIKGDNNEIK